MRHAGDLGRGLVRGEQVLEVDPELLVVREEDAPVANS